MLFVLLAVWAVFAEEATGDVPTPEVPATSSDEPKKDAWEEPGKVVFMDDETFPFFQEENKKFLALFYAPWCGHCKAIKPDYAAASKDLYTIASLVAVDCTASPATCAEFQVNGYPSIKWFSNHTKVEEYDSARTRRGLTSFVKRKIEEEILANWTPETDISQLRISTLKQALKDRNMECGGCAEKADFVKTLTQALKDGVKVVEVEVEAPPTPKPRRTMKEINSERRRKAASKVVEAGWEKNGKVHHLIGDDLAEFRTKNPKTLVIFYTTWCGHCTAIKPQFASASETAANTEGLTDVAFASIECDSNSHTCKKNKVSGYPTMIFFSEAAKEGAPINGRSEADIMTGLKIALGLEKAPPAPEREVETSEAEGGATGQVVEEAKPAEPEPDEFEAHEEL
eukprot:gb/GEZN01007206.1/.p1 GENE.gb/GEZN01007206.1/~~gb/GEZN01007206.1/.p1  ORF type:complete len:413 (+),score=82.57 gb/GEZN01007206.1/:43-1239(+)